MAHNNLIFVNCFVFFFYDASSTQVINILTFSLNFFSMCVFYFLSFFWIFLVCWQVECNKGHADEKQYFAQFVRELSEAFKPRGWLLSSAVSPSKTVIDAGYEVTTLSKYFDWIAVMAYGRLQIFNLLLFSLLLYIYCLFQIIMASGTNKQVNNYNLNFKKIF